MYKIACQCCLLILLCINGYAQNTTPERNAGDDSVKTTIQQLFDGMRSGDSSMVKAVFAPDAIFQTIATGTDGATQVKTVPLQKFLQGVGTPHTDVWDERITFKDIHIDHELASVWTPYQFYLGGKLHHCGVNSFQLVRLEGRWKIVYLIDTRRKTCN
jgi:hypothetical protein